MIKILIVILFISSNVFGQHYGNYKPRQLFFEGNSLMNYDNNSTVLYGSYVPVSIYDSVKTSNLSYSSRAISSRTQTQINTSLNVNILPFLNKKDIIVIWEGTNDMAVNNLSGAAAFANLKTYINTVNTYSAKIIVCTVIARDYITDSANLMTRISSYNQLVKDSSILYNYTVADVGAITNLVLRSDCSNTTYYHADKIHLVTTGYNLVINLIKTTIRNIL